MPKKKKKSLTWQLSPATIWRFAAAFALPVRRLQKVYGVPMVHSSIPGNTH